MKHLLDLENADKADLRAILDLSTAVKASRGETDPSVLKGQTWAMIFSKSSTRTRVSFEVGIHELGGNALFLNKQDIQLGRGEPIQDTARVLGRMVHGIVIRTYAQEDLEILAKYSGIPVVNALTDREHPCQILTDIFTYEEKRGPITGRTVTFIGDGACNVPISWCFAAAKLDFKLRIAAPRSYWPAKDVLQACGDAVDCTEDLEAAATGVDLLYTDVFVSMGMEAEAQKRIAELTGYQINGKIVGLAAEGALVMHCLPAYRGLEIDEETLEAHADTIFTQAENRLHTQKAVLLHLMKSRA